MDKIGRTKEFYDKTKGDMFKDISAYMAYGYVFKTPSLLLMGKAVDTNSDLHPAAQWNVKNPDAWYVHTAIGKVGINEFIKCIPYPLPKVGWMRYLKDKPVKFYDLKKIIRRK